MILFPVPYSLFPTLSYKFFSDCILLIVNNYVANNMLDKEISDIF